MKVKLEKKTGLESPRQNKLYATRSRELQGKAIMTLPRAVNEQSALRVSHCTLRRLNCAGRIAQITTHAPQDML